MQSVASPMADPAIASFTRSYTFIEIGHEIISMVILRTPSADLRRVVRAFSSNFGKKPLSKIGKN